MSADDAEPDADGEPGVSDGETGSDGPDVEEIRAEAREAVDMGGYEEAAEEMRRLLDADPIEGDVTPNEFAAVGEDLTNSLSSLRQRYRTQRREERKAAREASQEAGEDDGDAGPLAGTLGRLRGALAGMGDSDGDAADGDGPQVIERDGREVVAGSNPLGPVEEIRLQALGDPQHQDVYVRNEAAKEVRRGPPAGESDSPLMSKYHANSRCSNADFSARAYSRTALADAKKQAVPCPVCVITSLDAISTDTAPTDIRTLEDALDAAPAFEDLSYSEQQRVGRRTSGHNTPEKERHQSIVSYLTGDDEGATAAEIAARQGWPEEQTEDDLEKMANAGALEYRQGDEGRTVWRLAGAGM